MLLKKVFQLTTASFKYNPDLLKFRIKQYSDQKEKDEYVNAKYGQKIAWENSKSKKTPEMRWLKKEQNKYLQTQHRHIWTMNEEKQAKKLLAILKEDESCVFYVNENVTKIWLKN